MSDLKLVAPDQPTPFERMLLDAVANEAPSAEQRMRVRQALGLPALAISTAPVVKEAGRRALLIKAGIAGVAAVSVALVLVLAGVGRKAEPTFTPQGVAALAVAPSVAVPAAPAEVLPVPEPVAAALPPIEAAPSARASKRVARARSSALVSSAAADSGTDLSEQLRLIEAARAAVAAGNASAASSAIASYRTRFPRGPFGQEAAVLQIETLDLQGNHAQAASQARNFLARHPNSPHVSVVQRIADRAR